MTAPCETCAAAALDTNSGLYMSHCPDCTVRAVSQAPAHARHAYYRTIADDDQRSSFITAVQAEHARRKAAA